MLLNSSFTERLPGKCPLCRTPDRLALTLGSPGRCAFDLREKALATLVGNSILDAPPTADAHLADARQKYQDTRSGKADRP